MAIPQSREDIVRELHAAVSNANAIMTKPTSKDMHQHVLDLCDKHGITRHAAWIDRRARLKRSAHHEAGACRHCQGARPARGRRHDRRQSHVSILRRLRVVPCRDHGGLAPANIGGW
jgi:hypothetical protein